MSWHKMQCIIQNIVSCFPCFLLFLFFSFLFLYTAMAFFFHWSAFFRLIEHFDVPCFSKAREQLTLCSICWPFWDFSDGSFSGHKTQGTQTQRSDLMADIRSLVPVYTAEHYVPITAYLACSTLCTCQFV